MNISARYIGPPRGQVHIHHHGLKGAKDLMPGDRGALIHEGTSELHRALYFKRNGGYYKVEDRHIDQVRILGENEAAETI